MYRKFPLYIILLLLSFAWCAAQEKTITILHTNDMHASFVPHEATWMRKDPKPMIGGFNELYFLVDSIRKTKDVLLLDAGDVMTGNPITEYTYNGIYGGLLFKLMNDLKYDAWCFGNHDFDVSQENLFAITKFVNFPTLSANIVNAKNEFPLHNKPYTIIEKNGLRIGIIGITTQLLYHLVNESNLSNIKVLPPIETTQKIIDEIDSKTDVIIALTHEGVEDDSVLANGVTGLDVIVGGHSHTRLKKPIKVNDVIIVQAGGNCENLGVLNLTVDDDKVTAFDGELLPMWERDDHPKNKFKRTIDSMQAKIDDDYSEIIAELKTDWKRKDGESGIGNFIADAQRNAASADVAFMNNHGIRKDVSAGPLTKREMFEVLPFLNIITTFQLSGKELRDVVAYYIKEKPSIQTSGIICEYRKKGGEIEFTKLEINGKPIDEKKMYICTASDYMVGEAKRYIGEEVKTPIYSKKTVFEEVVKYAKTVKVINTKDEDRIQEIE
jgi:2',3'-cyclic-nucleotide 2'-phosphodiesterase (5'-nucleotidase family)